MVRLICTVRGCGRPLDRQESTLCCEAGHAFDRARQGYWNLLQPQDRRSTSAGDRDASTDARERWLDRGFALGLAKLGAELCAAWTGGVVLDVGCGGGWFTGQIAPSTASRCGVDLSRHAIALACRRDPGGTWVVANADRGLPLPSGSVDVALSIFGRRPAAELRRVVRPGGSVLVVVPAEDDLAELRAVVLGRATERDRAAGVVEELDAVGLRLDEKVPWRQRRWHDAQGLDDLLAMTYRGGRRSQRERLRAELGPDPELEVTLAATLMRFRPAATRS